MKIFLLIASFILSYALVVLQPPFDVKLIEKLKQTKSIAKLGGCGYEALYIKKYLDQKRIPSNIIVFGDNSHVMVLSNGCLIDKHGFFGQWHPITFLYSANIISEDSLQNLCNNSEKWNKKFNRADTILLKQILCPDPGQ